MVINIIVQNARNVENLSSKRRLNNIEPNTRMNWKLKQVKNYYVNVVCIFVVTG